MAEESLALQFIEYVKLLNAGKVKDNTFNGFYDWVNVPVQNRSDFASAAILNQVKKIIAQ